MQLISFVLPIYNEQDNIPKLWDELSKLKLKIERDYKVEFIFVNDGSKDQSINALVEIYQKNNDCVRIVEFARNHGHQIAVTAGQDIAKGDAVIIMDTDLQDPPETCLNLINEWEKGFDIVYAQRSQYKTNWFKQLCGWGFYRVLKKIASVDIPVDTGDFRLLSKRVNEEMKRFKEKSRYLRGITSLIGFKQTAIQFARSERFSGKPAYTFTKSLRLALDGITGFSVFPLQLISFVGMAFSVLGFVFGISYIIYAFSTGTTTNGWASLMFVMIFTSGIQMLMLGLIGEYLGRVYVQSLDRPLYTIDKILE
jgi:polyisoprenyl-phosphate glycosyltransferase